MRRFFIYSTPRSGSAWLANFLTYGDSFCKHEPLVDGRMVFADRPVSGAIDTGAAFIGYRPPEGTEIFHLSRDKVAVLSSLARLKTYKWDLSKYKTGFEYERLFDIGYLEDLWNKVTGLQFDKERAEMLIEMNVQRDMAALQARAIRRF